MEKNKSKKQASKTIAVYSFVAWTSISYWYFFTTTSLSKLNVLFADSQHKQQKIGAGQTFSPTSCSPFFLIVFLTFFPKNLFI